MLLLQPLFTLMFFLLPFAPVHKEDEEYIDWVEKRKLSWNDFEGPVDKTSDAAASTSTYLGFQYKVHNNVLTYTIVCRFSKKKSWGLIKNTWILNHEQGHFDIAEIFARRLHQKISDYKLNMQHLQTDLNLIYQQVVQEKEDFQNQYDLETDFSRNKTIQKAWLEKIDLILEESSGYMDYNTPPAKYRSK